MHRTSLIRRLLHRAGTSLLRLSGNTPAAPVPLPSSGDPDAQLNAHFRAIRDASPDGFFAFQSVRDRTGTIVDFIFTCANEAAAKIVMRSLDQLVHHRLLEVMPGNKTEGLFDAYVRVVETRQSLVRELQYNHEGLTVYVRLTAAPAGDGFTVVFTDMSDRRRVEDELRRSTTFLRAISESTQDVIFAKDLDGRLTFANPATLELIGKSESEVIGRTDMELLQDKTAARRVMENDRRIMQSGATEDLEEVVPLPDGTERLWFSRKVPYRDEHGNVAGLLGISRDITVRRAAEQRIAESERWFRLIVNSIPGHIWTARPDGSIDFAGPWMIEYTGLPPERLFGDEWHTVVHPDDLQRTIDAWTHSLKTGDTYAVEFRVRSRDGEYRLMSTRAVPQRDDRGRVLRWFGHTADIHEQREKDHLLRISAERLRLTAAAAGMGFWTIDLQSKTITLDDTCARLLELPADVAIPNAEVRQRIAADSYPRVRNAIDAASAGGRYEAEFQLDLPSGAQRWLGALGNVIREQDRAVRLVGVNWDITDRKRTEAERDALLAAERTARADAERASRLKDDFLATLSHELRTPLNAILGWAEILASPGASSEPETLRSGIDAIQRNARAQTELVNDLLDMSSIINGKLRLELQMLDLRPIILSAIETVRPAADARRVRVEAELNESIEPIRGDPHRLQQVVWNLMTNAVKFTPPGGRVRVTLQQLEQSARLCVIDTGQGIAPEFMPHVFDRFRQADASTRRRHGGLGLGLAIVRELVELHGGQVSASSDGLGRGATFTIDLPLLALPTSNDAPHKPSLVTYPPPNRPRRHRGKVLSGTTILAVDDEPDALIVVQRVLAEHGARVLLASSAAEAFNLLVERRPDVLLSDIGMPREDGYDLIRRIRALPMDEGGQTPAIALSAFARADDVSRSLKAGYQVHLSKPATTDDLLDHVLGLMPTSARGALDQAISSPIR